jgi:putative transposase
MPDIMVVLACLSQCVPPTPGRQLGRVIEAMLSISGRVTMKGLSRWSGKGGSYRPIQRLFNTPLNWLQRNWLLIRHHLWDGDEVALMSGDHVVVTKSGKTTHGLDRFFSSLYGKAVPGLCFLSLSVLSVTHRCLIRWLPSKWTSRWQCRFKLRRSKRSRLLTHAVVPKGARIAIVAR